MRERDWVRALAPRIEQSLSERVACIEVRDSKRLAYTSEIHRYTNLDANTPTISKYETDLLVYEVCKRGDWIPRVVIECKLGNVTTHDALTYSAKAGTHKHVHPYLRYGILAGQHESALQARLVRHGAYFDFMTVWRAAKPSNGEWKLFISMLTDEFTASRSLQDLLSRKRTAGKKYQLLHRPLRLK